MQKILSLSGKDFATGIAQSAHSPNSGLFHKADGIFPFVGSGNAENPNPFTLQAGDAPLSVSGITGNVVASALDEINTKTYVMDDDGKIYTMSGLTGTSVKTGLSNVGKGGMAIYQPRGGTKFLYYWNGNTQIGRFDLATTFVDGHFTGLQSTTIRPVHRLFDKVYYGNKDRVGSIIDDGASGVTHNANVLDFPSDFTNVDLTDDSFYLVVAITNATTGNDGVNKILFWDQISSSWNREWIVPDEFITNIVQKNGVIYIFGKDKLWACTFNQPPQFVRFIKRIASGAPDAAIAYHDVLLWGDKEGNINSYGKWLPDSPSVYLKPFSMGSSVSIQSISVPTVSTALSIMASGGDVTKGFVAFNGGNTGVSAETIFFAPEIANFVQPKRIDVTFAVPLVSGDEFNIDIKKDADTAAVDWGTASFAKHGAKRKVKIKKNLGNFEQFKLINNFVGGA